MKQLYKNKRVAFLLAFILVSLISSEAVYGQLSGTYTVGTGGDYTTFTGAGGFFEAVNTQNITGDVTASVVSNITEPGSNSLNFVSGMGSHTITIEPDGTTLRTINRNSSNPTFSFNGARNIIIDGRAPGDNTVGYQSPDARYLAITSSNGGRVINVDNDASDITVSYTFLQSSTSSCIVCLEQNSSSTGLDNISVTYSDITSYGSGYARRMFYSRGNSSSISNDNILVDHCNLDGLRLKNGMAVELTNTSAFTFTNNHVFQSTPPTFEPSGGNHNQHIFRINGGGTNHVIENNYFGGSERFCGGNPWSMVAPTNPGTFLNFRVHLFIMGATETLSFRNNTIQNFHIYGFTAGASPDETAFQSILYRGTFDYSNNLFGDTTGATKITIERVGDHSTTNNRRYDVSVIDPHWGGTAGVVNGQIKDNIITGVDYINNTTNTGFAPAYIMGIDQFDRAAFLDSLVRNRVYNINAYNRSGNGLFMMYGIYGYTEGDEEIAYNDIYNITDSGSVAGSSIYDAVVTGIKLESNNATINAYKNRVFNIKSITGNPVNGITVGHAGTGKLTAFNNMVALGVNDTSETPYKAFYIPKDQPAASINLFYNTGFVSGVTPGSSPTTTYAFYRDNTTPADATPVVIRNNLFYNNRIKGHAADLHYAMGTAVTNNWPASTSDYNIIGSENNFVANSEVCEWGTGNPLTFAAWELATGGEAESRSGLMEFLDAENGDLTPFSPFLCDYKNGGTEITTPAQADAGCPTYLHDYSITDDYYGYERDTCQPNIGAVEFNPAGLWIGNISTDWHTESNWCGAEPPTPVISAQIYEYSTGPDFFPEVTDSAYCHKMIIRNFPGVTSNTAPLASIEGPKVHVTTGGVLSIYNRMYVADSANMVHTGGKIRFVGNGAQNIQPAYDGYHQIDLLNGANKYTQGNVTINDSLRIPSGISLRVLANDTLTLNGYLTDVGPIDVNPTNTLVIGGTGLLGDLYMVDGDTLGALTINRATSGDTAFVMRTDLVVKDLFTHYNGKVYDAGFDLHLLGDAILFDTIVGESTGSILLVGADTAHQISGNGFINGLQLNDAQGAFIAEGDSLTVDGELLLNSGNFCISSNALMSVCGFQSPGSGLFQGKPTAVLDFHGPNMGNVGRVNFEAGADTIGQLLVNLDNSSATVNILSKLYVANQVNVTRGRVATTDSLMVMRHATVATNGTIDGPAPLVFGNDTTGVPLTLDGAGYFGHIALFDQQTNNDNLTLLNNLQVGHIKLLRGELLPGSHTISVYQNWTSNGTLGYMVPQTSTVAFVNANNTSLTGDQDFYNFTINKTAANQLSTTGSVLISNNLSLTQGYINNASNRFALNSTGSIIGGSKHSFVRGVFTHIVRTTGSQTRQFPVGKGLIYRPVTLTVDQLLADSTDYYAEHIESAAPAHTVTPPIDGASTKRYFVIEQSPATALNSAVVTLTYGSDDGVTDAAGLRVLKDDGAGNWVDLGGTGTGLPIMGDAATPEHSITSTINFVSFSDFVLGDVTSNPLPVELTAFGANLQQNHVVLNWHAATETNLRGYAVERSADGENFEQIGFVNATANNGQNARYQTTDYNAAALGHPMLYYRLKPINNDGSHQYSHIASVAIEQAFEAKVWPNPINNVVNISLPATRNAQNVTIKLADLTGRTLISQQTATTGATRLLSLPQVATLPAGWYLLVVQGEFNQQVFKLNKQ